MNEVIHSSFCGNLTSGGTTGSAKNYRGEYYDSETGLYYLNARYYDPTTQQFTQEDTYWGDVKDPDSLNLYGYCEGNPVMSSDPTGHSFVFVPKRDENNSNVEMLIWSEYGMDVTIVGEDDKPNITYYKKYDTDQRNNDSSTGTKSNPPSNSSSGSSGSGSNAAKATPSTLANTSARPEIMKSLMLKKDNRFLDIKC